MIDPERIPPHNLDAERAVLGLAMQDAAALARIAQLLTPADFYKMTHRLIFEAMRELAAAGTPADLLLLEHALRDTGRLEDVGGPAALAAAFESAIVFAHLDHYAAILREQTTRRESITLGARLMQLGHNGSDSAGILTTLRAEVDRIGSLVSPAGPALGWLIYDAAEEWDVEPVEHLIEGLLPLKGVMWLGGLPKRYKSLLLLYLCLALAAKRDRVAEHFKILQHPRILYVAREDGASRIKERAENILAAWGTRPEPGALKILPRPFCDLLNPQHVAALRDLCRTEGRTVLVLDTWTALSPGADPLGPKDQAQLAAVVVGLTEAIGGLTIVADHSRKNRPDGAVLSSADIFGPPQKWAAAEHILMLDMVVDRRVEVFLESKDMDGDRFFLSVSPRRSTDEKFTYAGSVAELVNSRREVGDANRQAVLDTLRTAGAALSSTELAQATIAGGHGMSEDTAVRHVRTLIGQGLVRQTGKGKATRYFALDIPPHTPSTENEDNR